MSQEHIKKAIAKKRGPAVEVSISVAPKEDKHTDLAPKGEMPPEPGHPDPLAAVVPNSVQEGRELEGVALPQMNPDDLKKLSDLNQAAEAREGMDPLEQALQSRVQDASKDDLKGRKPRSLMERATMAHMGK